MKPFYEAKARIFLKLVREEGKTADEAARICGYKHFESMRGSMCCEGAVDMKECLQKGIIVQWKRKKKLVQKKERDPFKLDVEEQARQIVELKKTIAEIANDLLVAYGKLSSLIEGDVKHE